MLSQLHQTDQIIMMTTYFCLLVSVLICKNYAEMTCQTVQQNTIPTLSCGHSEGDVTWSRDQDGGRVDILTVRKGQDSEDKHISDPDITMTPHTTKNPTTIVKNTVIKRRNKKDEKKDKKGEKNKKNEKKNKKTKNITMTPHTTKNPTTRVKNTDITMTPHTTENPTTRVENTDITMTPHTTKNPTTIVKNTDITMTLHTTKNPTTRVKNTYITMTPHTTKNPTTRVKNTGHWQLPVGVTTGGLVLVLVLLLVGFLIRRRWAQKAEGDRDRPQAVYEEISDVTQQPKDESCECSSRSKEHFVYNLASAQGTQKEVISMNPIYHTIQDPNITTNLNNDPGEAGAPEAGEGGEGPGRGQAGGRNPK
ncbi:uncharacterized protein LOC134040647 [Osmerus eperlanus]|uniref:uncharacterized protein LOC134040647 n=1 Tax=Osmerus eperlanus TaxID=29151 RepID=UPI002E0F8C58